MPRLLVVDDQGPLCRALARALRRDFEVTVALGGREAFDVITERDDFDAVLCDLSMPDLTGRDLYDWLLLRHPRLAASMVLFTGSRAGDDAEAYFEAHGVPVLDKPVDLEELRRILREVARARFAPSRPAASPAAPEPRPG